MILSLVCDCDEALSGNAGISVQFQRIHILTTCSNGRSGLSEDQQRQRTLVRGFNKVCRERPGIATAERKAIQVSHGETKSHRTKAISDNPRATPGGKPAKVYADPGRTHVTRSGFQARPPLCVSLEGAVYSVTLIASFIHSFSKPPKPGWNPVD